MLGYPHASAIPGELKGIRIPMSLLVDKKSSWFHSCFVTSLKPLTLLKAVILDRVLSSLTPSAVIHGQLKHLRPTFVPLRNYLIKKK